MTQVSSARHGSLTDKAAGSQKGSEGANADSQASTAVEPDAITKAKEFVQAHLGTGVSLGRVATAVNLSAGYFSELFHKATGLTFTEHLARARVEKVKSQLANTSLPITAIAHHTGFNTLSQFNRVFKRVCGVSAREYRQRLLREAKDLKKCAVVRKPRGAAQARTG